MVPYADEDLERSVTAWTEQAGAFLRGRGDLRDPSVRPSRNLESGTIIDHVWVEIDLTLERRRKLDS